jgi:hypothetical protein
MGQAAIAAKLSREFGADLSSEAQVVYILVETRKLLEQQKTLENFPTVKLCCDWAVHPKLCGNGAQDVLRLFDRYETERLKSGIVPAEFRPLQGFATHDSFRAELGRALEPHNVDVHRLRSDEYWRTFIRLYTNVIQDCPLEAREGETIYVSGVSGEAVFPDGQTVFPGKVVIRWEWKLKAGGTRTADETWVLI